MKEGKKRSFTLLDIMSLTEEDCKQQLAFNRWGEKPVCPYCDHDKCYTTKERYKCSKCRKLFSVRVGTPFEDSKIPLKKWFVAMYFVTHHTKPISSHQLAKDIEVTQRTAWFMLHRLRNTLCENGYEDKLECVVEIDETYVGGKNRNRHWDKKVPHSQGRSFKDKTPVVGMLERGTGKVRAQKVPDTKKKTLMPIIKKNIKKGSKVMTDEYRVYCDLHLDYTHKKVYHNRGQYVDGDAHTNGIEGFWSLLKRGILGVYHNVSPKHLDFYISEAQYKYNTRKMKGQKKFNKILKSDKQISYAQLTKDFSSERNKRQ
ncbi:MAG: IS1595 family transposase [Bacteroidetes bacterium]|nr:IS1595 family transposase [Bacteroidota bacterium]